MPTANDFIAPYVSTGTQGLARAASIRRIVYALADTDTPTDLVAVDAGTGAQPWGLAFEGRVFWLDPDDTTTAHDGISCIVTSDGYRYKTEDVRGRPVSVLANDVDTPPGSPAPGDAYLVPAAPTGDWADHADAIATWTARGWRFLPPQVGFLVYVEATGGFWHYDETGTWVAGIGSSALAAGDVEPANILGGRVTWVVENQTTNAPPGSPSDGVQYIIGPAPTGAWSGHAAKLAIAKNSAWIIIAPGTGYKAFDKSTGQTFVYNGSGWISDAGAYVTRYSSFTAALTSQTIDNNTSASNTSRGYSYSDTSAPTTSNEERVQSLLTTAITAKKAGALFEVEWQGRMTVSGTRTGGSNCRIQVESLGVWVDNESAARDWVALESNREYDAASSPYTDFDLRIFMVRLGFTLADTSAHTIRLRWLLRVQAPGGNTHQFTAFKCARQSVIIREVF